jgi:hypothetical protein
MVSPPVIRFDAISKISQSEYIAPLSEKRSLAIFSIESATCLVPRCVYLIFTMFTCADTHREVGTYRWDQTHQPIL